MSTVELARFEVHGKPEPQGSAKAFVPTDRKGQVIRRPGGSIVVNITSDNPELKKWRKLVAEAAEEAWGRPPLEGVALEIEIAFYLKRPEADWGTGRNAALLKDSAAAAPMVIPDVDKLVRGVLDGLTGVIYRDDAQVTRVEAEKRYAVPDENGNGQGAAITVREANWQRAGELPQERRVRHVEPEPLPVDEAQLAL